MMVTSSILHCTSRAYMIMGRWEKGIYMYNWVQKRGEGVQFKPSQPTRTKHETGGVGGGSCHKKNNSSSMSIVDKSENAEPQ